MRKNFTYEVKNGKAIGNESYILVYGIKVLDERLGWNQLKWISNGEHFTWWWDGRRTRDAARWDGWDGRVIGNRTWKRIQWTD